MAQIILSFAPFQSVIMNRNINEDASSLTGEALETVVAIANKFGLQVNNLPLRLPFFSDRENLHTINEQFETCSLVSGWLDFKCTVLFLGDGTISNEFNEKGYKLEGGHLASTTCYLINALTAVRSDQKFLPYIDTAEIDTIINTLQRTGSIERFIDSLVEDDIKSEKIESFLLISLSSMKVAEEILLPAGFRGHATAILVVKRSMIFYDIYAFNSGGGLQHHDFVIRDGQKKYFAAKRYLGLTLFALYRSHFFRKYAELKGIGHHSFDSPEEASITVTDVTLYQYLLSTLDDFAVPYTAKDLKTVPLNTEQRSGSCAMRSLLAYILWKVEKSDGLKSIESNTNFRILKLMLYNIIISKAAQKNWRSSNYTLKRVLKFGMENYARSLLRYSKELRQGGPSLDLFAIPEFAMRYKNLTSKRTTAAADIQNQNRASFTVENLKFQGNAGIDWRDLYSATDFQLLQNLTPETFLSQIRLLTKIVNGKWKSVPRVDALTFVLSVVINEWPDLGAQLYSLVTPQHIDLISEALYHLFSDLDTVAFTLAPSHLPTFVVHVKLLGIVTDLFSNIHADIKRCKLLELDISKYAASYLMSDQRQARIINDIYSCGEVECFKNGQNVVVEGSPLGKFFTDRRITSLNDIVLAFCNPMKYSLPKIAHYWRLMAKKVNYCEVNLDLLLEFNFKPDPIDSPDVCRLSVIDSKPTAKCDSDEFRRCGLLRRFRLQIETKYDKDWPHRSSVLSEKNISDALPIEPALVDHVLFGHED